MEDHIWEADSEEAAVSVAEVSAEATEADILAAEVPDHDSELRIEN